MKYRYKNTSDQDLALIGVGTVGAGEIIETDQIIENPNLELVSDGKKKVNKESGDVIRN